MGRTMKIEIRRCPLEHQRSHCIRILRSLCCLVGFAMLLVDSGCNRRGNVEIKTGAGNYCSVINRLVWTSNADSPAPTSGPAVTTFNIFIMDDMGGHRTRLTSDSWPVMNQHPVFTPDCQKIVWTHGGPDQSALWVMNADGSSKTQLLTPPSGEADDHPWVGADDRVYFVRHRHPSGVHGIWRVNLDGTGPVEVVSGADKDRFHPNLRRDRKLVLYSAVPPGSLQGTEIRIFDMDTKQDTVFYTPGWPVSAATWRPDGNAVIVAEKRNGDNHYRITELGYPGAAFVRTLTDDTQDGTIPYYAYPSGTSIDYVRWAGPGKTRNIVRMNADGSSQVLLTNDDFENTKILGEIEFDPKLISPSNPTGCHPKPIGCDPNPPPCGIPPPSTTGSPSPVPRDRK